MINLYCVFHLNLAYSSVEEELRSDVVKHCYWPLLRLVQELKLPLGIEASGYTLEKARMLDARWIAALKESLSYAEFVGSGYTQMIGPLCPSEVNRWNQRIGMQTYTKILGLTPTVALINEMAYAASLVDIYREAGYQAIIMEWNNPRKYHHEWEDAWRNFPQYAVGGDQSSKIPIIWADSIAFQKFQRYVHGEMNLPEFIAYLQIHTQNRHGYFPLYASDAEIFDFRPGRYEDEAKLGERHEWDRIKALFQALKDHTDFRLVSPTEVLDGLAEAQGGNSLRLESPEQPIPVKKQEKYNITRWALTGRNNLECNTACYQIYTEFLRSQPTETDWKELCYLWSSDFRTHITPRRWEAYRARLRQCVRRRHHAAPANIARTKKITAPLADNIVRIDEERHIIIDGTRLRCVLSKRKGLAISELIFKAVSDESLLGTLAHGYYEDISWAADFFSGHSIIEQPGEHKTTDLEPCMPYMRWEGRTLVIGAEIRKDDGTVFTKCYRFDPEAGSLGLELDLFMPARVPAMMRLINMTFIPDTFERKSLFFSTHLGGADIETFRMGDREIHHSLALSSLISARQGLGNTEGIVIVGDANKRLIFKQDLGSAALIAYVHYSQISTNQYFLRLSYSAQEMDETFREDPRPLNIRCRIQISGEVHTRPEGSSVT
ncbi:hypothetical protein [Syntrophorhabdus aromaticivorans]|uniref:hypothetical protein n=1 Tax=Syntrophorhabdus aromaticivorans TaxID=328301 RepID=UPI000406898A|nr:hypothetical protein [Syntrophorhabdus aromaticivorans]